MRDEIWRLARKFDPSAKLEVKAPDSERADRPGDVVLRGLRAAGRTYIDCCIANPLQSSCLSTARGKAGAAAEVLAAKKCAGPGAQSVRSQGEDFRPVAGEAFGGWMTDSYRLLFKLADKASGPMGEHRNVVAKRLFERLSVIVMRYSAEMVLELLPRRLEPADDSDTWGLTTIGGVVIA